MVDDGTGAQLDRRSLLAAGAAGVLATAFGRSGTESDEAFAADLANACRLTPEQSEGPYYVDLEWLRRNVKEGKRGLRLRLRLVVVDARTCRTLPKAAVDIWHADAAGVYSGFEQEGTAGKAFLRGAQVTNAKGVVVFETIYPGAYRGRAPHIHTKVHLGVRKSGPRYLGGRVAHTGQLYFPEAINDRVYRLPTYRPDGRRTRNADDGLYTQQGGARSLVKVAPLVKGAPLKGYVASIVLGVDPDATA